MYRFHIWKKRYCLVIVTSFSHIWSSKISVILFKILSAVFIGYCKRQMGESLFYSGVGFKVTLKRHTSGGCYVRMRVQSFLVVVMLVFSGVLLDGYKTSPVRNRLLLFFLFTVPFLLRGLCYTIWTLRIRRVA